MDKQIEAVVVRRILDDALTVIPWKFWLQLIPQEQAMLVVETTIYEGEDWQKAVAEVEGSEETARRFPE